MVPNSDAKQAGVLTLYPSAPQQPSAPRIARIADSDPRIEALLRRIVDVAISGLPQMFLPDKRTFAFRRDRVAGDATALNGTSTRYGAIVLLGARFLSEEMQRRVLCGETCREFARRLISKLSIESNIGDIALLAWAASELSLGERMRAYELLTQRNAAVCPCFVVEAAWVLSALAAAGEQIDVSAQARAAADRLISAFSMNAGVFPHWTHPTQAPWARRHVSCFADQVYPIQALARFSAAQRDSAALSTAARCAEQICRVQGPDGQWWWHYDARNGNVVEGYPVYTVHQDSMAPMALLDLHDAGGPDFAPAIRRGLGWMESAAEVNRTLIDDDLALIWRKVARRGPSKFVRSVRAVLSRIHPGLRAGVLDRAFPPRAIDYEDRPYHLGWILFTWLGGR
jgi:hypothetical protein